MRNNLRKLVNVLDGQPTGARGQSMVEMALTFPILILMILGLAEIGFVANNYLILMDVLRDSARFATNLDPTIFPSGQPDGARNEERQNCNPSGTDMSLSSWELPNSINRVGFNSSKWTFVGPGYYLPNIALIKRPQLGFFDAVVCHALGIMDPLKFNDTTTGKDDIIVSAVSYAAMNYGSWVSNANPNVSGAVNSTFASNGYANASPPDPWYTVRLTVTGRWPLENRYCSDDYRDPFDYIQPQHLNYLFDQNNNIINNPTHSGTTPDQGELGYGVSGVQPPLTLTSPQGVRGFVLTGKYQNVAGCYGSDFTVQKIEQFLNSPFSSDGDVTPGHIDVRASSQNGALIILEMHWQHHPLIFGPLFQGFTNGNTANDPMLYLYAIFPVTAAVPTATP